MSEDLIPILTELGLNRYEAKAYVALLIRGGVATASEVSDLSGIPYTRVYDVLSSLESKGFVATVPGRPMRFQALDPDIALKNLLEIHRRKVMAELRTLEHNVRRAMKLLARLKPGSRGHERVFVMKGRVGIRNFVKQLIRNAVARVLEVRGGGTEELISGEEVSEVSSRGVEVIKREISDLQEEVTLLIIDDTVVIYEPQREVPTSIGEYDRATVIRSKQVADILHRVIKASY